MVVSDAGISKNSIGFLICLSNSVTVNVSPLPKNHSARSSRFSTSDGTTLELPRVRSPVIGSI